MRISTDTIDPPSFEKAALTADQKRFLFCDGRGYRSLGEVLLTNQVLRRETKKRIPISIRTDAVSGELPLLPSLSILRVIEGVVDCG